MSTGDDSQKARDWLHSQIQPNTAALGQALANAAADGYSSAALALAAQGELAKSLAVAAEAGDWGSWQPGNVDAAALLDDNGFKALLSGADVRIKGIADTTLDRMGTLLAEGAARGDSVDTIANALYDLVGDADRAYTIADTELARAMTQASLDTYRDNGIELWDWVLSPDACDECSDEQSLNPHQLNDEGPPAHPSCRCAVSPVVPRSSVTDGEE